MMGKTPGDQPAPAAGSDPSPGSSGLWGCQSLCRLGAPPAGSVGAADEAVLCWAAEGGTPRPPGDGAAWAQPGPRHGGPDTIHSRWAAWPPGVPLSGGHRPPGPSQEPLLRGRTVTRWLHRVL